MTDCEHFQFVCCYFLTPFTRFKWKRVVFAFSFQKRFQNDVCLCGWRFYEGPWNHRHAHRTKNYKTWTVSGSQTFIWTHNRVGLLLQWLSALKLPSPRRVWTGSQEGNIVLTVHLMRMCRVTIYDGYTCAVAALPVTMLRRRCCGEHLQLVSDYQLMMLSKNMQLHRCSVHMKEREYFSVVNSFSEG